MKLTATLASLVLALAPAGMVAQVATGIPQFGSYGGGPFDTINLGNLNVYFSIPIVNKAGRGMPFNYNLVYNSSMWSPANASGAAVWTPALSFGWNAQTAVATGYLSYHETFILGRVRGSGGILYSCPSYVYSGFVYVDPFGVSHPFLGSTINNSGQPPQCNPPASQPSFTATATDGSAYSISVTSYTKGVLTAPTGRLISPPETTQTGSGVLQDPNGNQISTTGNGVFTDTLGTTALTVAGGAPNPETFSYTNPQGAQSSYSMNYQTYTVATDFQVSGISEYGPVSNSLVSSIQLPDGTSYTFTYEPTPAAAGCTPLAGTVSCVTGRIASVTLPTGGTITYQYGGGPSGTGIYSDGSTADLTRTLNPGGEWQYVRALQGATAPGPGSSWTTTITDPSENVTVGTFAEDSATSGSSTVATYNLYQTEQQVYQGSSTLLQTRIDCYNVNFSNCAGASVTTPISETDTYTVLPNGSARLSETVYDGAYSGSGLVSQDYEYDYGVNQGSAPTTNWLTSTSVSYATLTGIAGLPSSVTVHSWNGSQVTQTQLTSYSYDQGSVTTTSGTPQHVSVTGSRGNLTTLAQQANSSTTLYSTFSYYDTGNLITSTGLSTSFTPGPTTTYVYGSGSCGNSFVTTIDEPLSLSRSTTWNCAGGVVTQTVDENGQTVTTNYTDPYFWRPANSYDQENNETTIAYSGQTATESELSFNSANSLIDIRSTVDGFGRSILSQQLQGPGATNYNTAEIDYNSVGLPNRVTMPFVATAGGTSSSAPAVVAEYDALGRPLSESDADGGTTSFTYTNNDVLVSTSGTQTFKKQLEYDGLGRLSSICEMSVSTPPNLPNTGTCGQTTPQTGYWTRYTYDALGHLLTVTQNAQASSGHQTRSYSYDMLGRMTSESNPESGTTSYTYDVACTTTPASAGDLTRTVDNAGNNTCFAYDALHRLVGEGWNNVCRFFNYDTSVTPPSGVSVANTKSRLLEAYSNNCDVTTYADEWFSYSPRGELTDVYESTPHSGGYLHANDFYWPSGAVETEALYNVSGGQYIPIIYYGASNNSGAGLDGMGRYTQVTAGSTPNPVTSVTYSTSSTSNPLGALTGVTYGSSDSDSFSYDPNTGRPNNYIFSANGSTDTGSLTWSTNGTLASLGIADGISGTGDSQSCTYAYDDLARSLGVNCGSAWQQSFSYDAFGNIDKSGSSSFAATYSSSTNQFSLSGTTVQYDGDGNLLADNLNTYTWDPNWGNMTSVDTGTTTITATYDALGRVVEQDNGSSYEEILWSPIGKAAILNGTSLIKAFVNLPGGGTAVYTPSGGSSTLAYYRHADWLGSSRLATTQARGLYSDTAYAPFGEQYATAGAADPSFTGQNSDTVPSLYDFVFRRLSSSQGRWISPDPAGMAAVDFTNPQSWNRYAYVADSPMQFIDSLGLFELDQSIINAGGCTWDVVGNQATLLGCDPSGGGGSGAGGGGGGGSAPSNPKCSTAIMQPQYTSIFGQMGNQLKINPLFVMSTALQESGWNLAHVYGTNSSSHGQPLNNLFGMTNAGGNNIAYPSVQASAQAWIADWGSYLSGQPQTIQAYAAALNSNPQHMYNSNPAYPGQLAARYKQLVSATAACGTTF